MEFNEWTEAAIEEGVLQNYKSRHWEEFCKKDVLKNFTLLTGKHLCQSLFFNKAGDWKLKHYLKGGLGTGVFPWILRKL